MTNTELIAAFYKAFAERNAQQMTELYSDDVVFSDPAFGTLHGKRAKAMWHMLLSRSKGALNVSYQNIQATPEGATAQWKAVYPYGPQKRTVVNHVTATFVITDEKIVEHHDHFNLYKWSKQALGVPGYMLGWTGFMRNKIQSKTNALLHAYMEKNN